MLAVSLVTVALGLAGLFGCSSSGESGSTATAARELANLRIAVWPEGKQRAARPVRWTLQCGPLGGTLPHRESACERLRALRRPFRAVTRGTACTQIYGGPQVAEVRGRFRGRPVASRFTRTDGCQIQRWNRVRFLFPASSN